MISNRKIRRLRGVRVAGHPAAHERRVQVDDVRHHGRADDRHREQRRAAGQPWREHARRDRARRRAAHQDLQAERHHDDADERGDRGLDPPEAADLHREHREGSQGREQGGQPDRQAEYQVQAQRRPRELGQVGGHRDRFGLQPQEDHEPPGQPVPANLWQGQPRGDAELGGQGLHEHRHQVGAEHDPAEGVAELRAGGHVGGEVSRVDVGDGGDERRPEKGQYRPQAPPFTGQGLLSSDCRVNQPRAPGRGTAGSTSRATAGAGPHQGTRTRSSARGNRPTGSAPRRPACWS